jgi:hypothetical protein
VSSIPVGLDLRTVEDRLKDGIDGSLLVETCQLLQVLALLVLGLSVRDGVGEGRRRGGRRGGGGGSVVHLCCLGGKGSSLALAGRHVNRGGKVSEEKERAREEEEGVERGCEGSASFLLKAEPLLQALHRPRDRRDPPLPARNQPPLLFLGRNAGEQAALPAPMLRGRRSIALLSSLTVGVGAANTSVTRESKDEMRR